MDLEAKNKIRNKDGFKPGYTEIVSKESNPEMLMTFGVLNMKAGDSYSNDENLERIYVLLQGEAELNYDGNEVIVQRDNLYDHDPRTLHLPPGIKVDIKALTDNTEFTVHRTENDKTFPSKLYGSEELVNEVRGKGTMNETGTRLVRTIIDYSIDPKANFMIGEDVQYPGKWAGFPSHSHDQPEIYFYRFLPENGFGLLKLGDQGVCLEQNDTCVIPVNLVHPQVAAPGYAMYFLWVIRHLDGNPYLGPDFEEQHLWAEKPDAKIWPDK
ncbi:MAG: 5-deoxy-glucuronate isomerase [Spirochaetales bacterium]|uniref:5-deoxy-glucuronate isomerase n=1 Tax=Candidatus Thalassospirochaeta sargassi TaxID=3119039 RepID=A0AAJ1MJF7_9SPIO|nr:5-deoxy-glucuronate isomerase [Spirochaetales bacterium]